jgi:uncharacterized alpha-E superfamily protein
MILSRVADGLYWMGRYLERAENTARLLLVTEEMSTEVYGLDEELARGEWRDLAEIFPGPPLPERATRHVSALTAATLQSLAFSPAHPNSVHFSLKRARDNARTVREALTVEVFVNLNETYQDLEAQAGRRLNDPTAYRSALSAAHRGILSTVGAIEHTLTRDPGWLFLHLGESTERLYRAATVLRTKLPALVAPEPKVDLPLLHTRWRALLRGLSSLENFRQSSGARLEPLEVLHFLLFDPHAPRSLRYGTNAVKDVLDRLSAAGHPNAPVRQIGRLAAELTYRSDEVIQRGEYITFLDSVLDGVTKTHEAVSALYFGT